jgi:beta-N-acetylhexosaminidase
MRKAPKIALPLLLMCLAVSAVHGQSLREKIGQMIMVGFNSDSQAQLDTLQLDITARNLGGVILFGRNIKSPSQVKSLTSLVQKDAQIPLFISTDQEGGRVARFNSTNGYATTSTAYVLGSVVNSESTTRGAASQMADWLSDAGVNVNLAPVADVNVNPTSPAIGALNRSYSSDPWTVFDHTSWFADEFRQRQVFSTLKHFPGHGSAVSDSHLGFTDVTSTWSDTELIPYQMLIDQSYTDFIMSGHLFNANLDPDYPASLSYATITTLLKETLGFQGAVISDELFMRAIKENYTFEEAIVLAVNAGTDVLLYSTNVLNDLSLVRQVIDVIEENVIAGNISQSRIDDAYATIMRLKQDMIPVNVSESEAPVPDGIELTNYPNPFSGTTTIEFIMPDAAPITVSVYNAIGQEIATLVSGRLGPGTHKYRWDGSTYPNGIYYFRVTSDRSSVVKKMTLLNAGR